MQKKIMVPLGPGIHDLNSVHYALAAGERLRAEIIILRVEETGEERRPWLEEALADLVASARLAGLKLTIVEGNGTPEREIVDLAEAERIDLLVFGGTQQRLERKVLELEPSLSHMIIQVQEKGAMNLDSEEGGSRWQS